MDNERSAAINIGGKDFELILTTRATKAIANRYLMKFSIANQLTTLHGEHGQH